MANNVVSMGEHNNHNTKSQRPSSSAFKQQKLPAWQPILTAGTVLPTFFLIGIAFIPIGIGLLVSSNQVQEFELNYTACEQYIENGGNQQKRLCSEVISAPNWDGICLCKLNFTLEEDFKRDVFIYYGLTNFYQNHRRYVKSRDDRQLLGEKSASTECQPFDKREDSNKNKISIAPCGAIANSLFNDTFLLQRYPDSGKEDPKSVPVTHTGIAWATDKNAKYKNPKLPDGKSNLSYAFEGTISPPNWRKPVWDLDKDDNNNGYLNEGLIVWMRTAALPTFRKLYARIAHDKRDIDVNYQNSLPKGQYLLTIKYNYPVATFKGTKRFIISNTSWLGGRNPFIGVIYIIVGCVCLLLSGVFVLIHKKFGKSTSEILSVTQRTSYIG